MLETVLYAAVASLGLLFGIVSAFHALMNKRDPRSQLGWVILCMLLPVVGGAAYWLLGVNRIRTRARKWQARGLFEISGPHAIFDKAAGKVSDKYPEMADSMLLLLQIGKRVTNQPLLDGNRVEPLFDGEEAYPAMLAAIREAKHYVCLCTYIFDTDAAGREFVEALGEAAARGVDVRVMVDAIGERYSRPRVSKLLRQKPGVRVAAFLPLTISLRGLRVNLRNHRKLLVVDGEVGFTGGMNIGQRHMARDPDNRRPTSDIHFRVRGPAVSALEKVFFEDWQFTTREGDFAWARSVKPAGEALCRGVKDGPNEDFEKMLWILVGALTCARESVRIMTPYFVPGRELVAAFIAAALRGTRVELILPRKNNLPFVAWASQAMLWEVMQYGVKVYYQPPPFNHSKLLIADDFYVNIGSANLDPRSLRLNFEFNMEIYDPELGSEMARFFDDVRERSEPVTLEKLEARPFLIKLRDASAKLFSPYL